MRKARSCFLAVAALLLLAIAVVAAPFQGYPGPAQPDSATALFAARGDRGITPLTWVYKIDGRTRSEFASGVLPFGYNKTHAVGAFALSLLPGEHTIEIVLNNRRGPMAKGATAIEAKRIRLQMEAGRSYRFSHDVFSVDVAYDGKNVGSAKPVFTVEPVPTYTEPAAASPHATLTYTRVGRDEIDPYLLRVDDSVTSTAGAIPDVNYSLPVFKSFSGAQGSLNLRLPPSTHRLEFILLGGRLLDGLVQTETVTVEAGKTYTLQVDKTEIKGSTLLRATLRLIEP